MGIVENKLNFESDTSKMHTNDQYKEGDMD